MKRILLATTAAAALMAGSSLALAQASGGGTAGAGGPGIQQKSPGGTGPGAATHGGTTGSHMTQGAQTERGGQQGVRGGERQGQLGKTDRDNGKNARGEEHNGKNARGEERGERTGQLHEGREGGRVTRLSSDQRTRIHERLFSEHANVHRLGHVDFALRAGVRVPRSVTFYDLPPDIVQLVPAYRAYKYFLVGDEIVIVDPATHEIVDVIPA
jgi:hypothetical protein